MAPRLVIRRALFLVLMGSLCASAAAAKTKDNRPASLRFVPADAAFYEASLRTQEQLDILMASRAWSRLKAHPWVTMARQMADSQLNRPGSPLQTAAQLMELPENQDLIAMIKDMFGREAAVYGKGDWPGFAQLVVELVNAQRFGRGAAQLQAGLGKEVDEQKMRGQMLLEVLKDHADDLRLPTTVFAFRIKDPKRAQTQIKRLEVFAALGLQNNPALKDRLKRIKVGKASFLSLTLDGSLVPWEQADISRFEDEPGEYDVVIEKLKAATVNVCLGVRGNYLILSIAPSSDHLSTMGQGKLLVAEDPLKPLKKFSDRPLVQVSYVSKPFMQAVGMQKQDLDDLAEMVPQMLEGAELSEAMTQRLASDAKKLADDLKPHVPELGATLAFSFLTDHGYESYSYNWTQNLSWDASRRLSLLDHLGGQPLLAVVGHRKYAPEEYELLVKWVKTAAAYADEIAREKLPPEQQEKYKLVMENVRPLAARANDVTRTKLIPALASGEAALVLDADITSRRWHAHMPPSEKPLTMLEGALVLGVSDPKLLREAVAQYRAIIKDAIERARKINPKARPDEIKLPPLETKELGSATIYWYPMPKKAQLDRQITPAAGLSDSVAVVASGRKQTVRLLATKPLAGSQLIANSDRPLAAAVYFDWAGLVRAASPWVEYGVEQHAAKNHKQEVRTRAAVEAGGGDAEPGDGSLNNEIKAVASDTTEEDQDADRPADTAKAAEMAAQAKELLEILQALRTIESLVYAHDGAMVTHSAVYFEDLK